MSKAKKEKDQKADYEIELEGLIEKNENMTKGMKKIIDSIEGQKSNNIQSKKSK